MTLRQFLVFTAISLPACALLILLLDQPLAGFIHAHSGVVGPVFRHPHRRRRYRPRGADDARAGPAHHFPGLLGLAFALGRYALKRRGATLFLGAAAHPRVQHGAGQCAEGRRAPAAARGAVRGGYAGTGLWATGPHNDSFPSTTPPSISACSGRWRWRFRSWRVPLLVLPGLIALGRLVLGAHYLCDVWFSVWLVVALTFLFGLLDRPRAGERETCQNVNPAGPLAVQPDSAPVGFRFSW